MDVLLAGLGPDLAEIRTLVGSAGYHVAREVVQRRSRPHPRFFVGRGKLKELEVAVKEARVDAVVFAGALHPRQHYELERALGVECLDRLRVILETFTRRAHSREAKLQVELAMLQYEMPILREWIHRASLGERPGFMAGGEYRVDAYYKTVKRKMKKVRDELEAVKRERAVRRGHRQERGFYHVSIAGYANAGKSSLFNNLSGEHVLVEDRMFTTLSTTTRSLRHVRKKILLTDTVGLVSDVPLWLVEAFRSTFEEVYASDLVLLLFDASDSAEDFDTRVRLASSTLLAGMESARILPVLTKVDLVNQRTVEGHLQELRNSDFVRSPLAVSVKAGEGLDRLRGVVVDEFRYPIELTIRVAWREGSGAFLNWLYDRADVLSLAHRDKDVSIHLRCRNRDLSRIQREASVVAGPAGPT